MKLIGHILTKDQHNIVRHLIIKHKKKKNNTRQGAYEK